jgi:hypothetical protein
MVPKCESQVSLKKASEERLKKGRDTLFGHRVPREDIASLLRDGKF